MIRRVFIGIALLTAALGTNPAQAGQTPLPLVNPGFEGTYTALPSGEPVTGATAPGWNHNSGYGNTTAFYARETTNPHSGSACQAITVSAVRDGSLQLLQDVSLKAGTIVTFSAWMRGAPGTFVDLTVQGGAPGYPQIASIATPIGPKWQRVLAQGYVTEDDTAAAIVIGLNSAGTVCIDDMTVTTQPGTLKPALAFGPITPAFFGIHVSNFQLNRLRNPGFALPQTTLRVTGNLATSPARISGEIAHGWEDNSDWADVAVNYRADLTPVPGGGPGGQAVEITAVNSGNQQLRQSLRVHPGLTYTLTALLRGTPGMAVDMQIRNTDEPFNDHARRTVADLGLGWKSYSLTGNVAPSGRIDLMFSSATPGTYSVADVQFTTSEGKAPPPGARFPPPGFGVLRLWDSGTTWAVMEPKPGKWVFSQLDRWIAAAQPGQEIMLTLGQSPTWASSDPDWLTYNGAGAAAPPKNLADWINYVSVIARRYKGRIKYYEIWNEPNDKTFYAGTVAQLVELTRTASETIRSIDPDAKLISAPAYSPGYLERYLAAGAAQYVDVIGYHIYATPPEEAARQLGNVRLVLARRLLTAKPLWDTEGGSGDASTPPEQARTFMARRYLVDLAFGSGHFGWYGWGPVTPFAVGTVPESDPRKLTPAASAFAVVRGWLLGASLSCVRIDGNGAWRMTLDLPSGKRALVLWNPKRTARFALPLAFRGGTLTDLDGKTTPLTGTALDLTFAPVLVTAP